MNLLNLKIFALVVAITTVAAMCAVAADAEVDPVGRPKSFASGKKTEYAVWFADGMWHIRASAEASAKVHFRGSVHVEDGEIADGSFAGLEMAAHHRQSSDWVDLAKDKRGFEFLFRTVGRMDGLNFKLSDSATNVTFGLLVGSETSPKNILVGSKEVHPGTNPFTLKAHPDEDREKPARKKKKNDG